MLKKIINFLVPPSNYTRYHLFRVKCGRCGEIIEGRVDTHNELSVEYQNGRETYRTRKILIGSGRCYQQIEVEMTFDARRALLSRTIQGGEFVEAPAEAG